MSWAARPSCPFYCLYPMPRVRRLVGPLGAGCAILSAAGRWPMACRMDLAGLRPAWERCGFDQAEASAALARWLREGWSVVWVEAVWQ